MLSCIAGKEPAEILLQKFDRLSDLARASFDELTQIKGIGSSKAKAIRSAFLLAQRLSQETYQESPVLDTPEHVANLFREENRLYQVEHLQVALLNTRRRLISTVQLGKGTLDSINYHPREIFIAAITRRASALILVHNHPSGDPTPSDADITMTREIMRAGRLLKIEVLDHIILGHRTENRAKDYASLRELGYLF